jgi:hypothetical protein
MIRATVLVRTAVVVGAAAMTLTGCGNAVEGLAEGAVEKALENEIGPSADVQIDDDSFTVDTEEGSITAGAGSVPDDFPADVPLPEGEVSFAQRLESAEGLGWSVVVTTSGDPTAVAEQVGTDLESSGFTVENASQFGGADGSGGTVLAEKDDLSVLVLVTGDGGETVVTYTVSQTAS